MRLCSTGLGLSSLLGMLPADQERLLPAGRQAGAHLPQDRFQPL